MFKKKQGIAHMHAVRVKNLNNNNWLLFIIFIILSYCCWDTFIKLIWCLNYGLKPKIDDGYICGLLKKSIYKIINILYLKIVKMFKRIWNI